MRRNLVLLFGVVIAWGILGAVIAGFSTAVIVRLGRVIDVMIIGATLGAPIGLFIGVMGLMNAFNFRSTEVVIWMTGGSIIGAIIGLGLVVIIGGYPKGSQADLSFLALGPAGVAIGGLLGTAVGVTVWKSRRNLH